MVFKFHKQQRGYCGISCLAMGFSKLGYPVSEEALIKSFEPDHEKGCDIIANKKILEELIPEANIRTLHKLNAGLREVAAYTRAGIPVIPYVWEWENAGTTENPVYKKSGHYIFVRDVTQTVKIANPASNGPGWLRKQHFENKWYDIERPCERGEILVFAPESKFAKMDPKYWPAEMRWARGAEPFPQSPNEFAATGTDGK
jgi:hypothetical protein